MIEGFNFNKAIEHASSVKLKGGIFTKTCAVLIVVCLSMFGIASLAGNVWISAGALVMIFVLVFVFIGRLIKLASKNPQAVLYEGAEFLIHEKIQLAAAKGVGIIQQLGITPETPILLDEKKKEESNKPDSETPKTA